MRAAASKSRTEDTEEAVGSSGSGVGVGTGVRRGAKAELRLFFSVGDITHHSNPLEMAQNIAQRVQFVFFVLECALKIRFAVRDGI